MKPKVAVCAILRNEARYLEEWLWFHIQQGVRAFRLYDNGSTDSLRIAASRVDFPVDIVRWKNRSTWLETQTSAYLDGAAELREYDFVAFIDIDEFLFCPDGASLRGALVRFPIRAGAIAVCQRVFGSSGEQLYDPRPVTTRFVQCAPENHLEHRWFKTVARPRSIKSFNSAHSVLLNSGDYVMADSSPLSPADNHPGVADRVVNGHLRLHHYPLKSLAEFKDKQARHRAKPLCSWEVPMEEKYSMAYFEFYDSFANACTNRDLVQSSDVCAVHRPDLAP